MDHSQSPDQSARQARRPANSVTAELPSELKHRLDDFDRHLSQVVGLAVASNIASMFGGSSRNMAR